MFGWFGVRFRVGIFCVFGFVFCLGLWFWAFSGCLLFLTWFGGLWFLVCSVGLGLFCVVSVVVCWLASKKKNKKKKVQAVGSTLAIVVCVVVFWSFFLAVWRWVGLGFWVVDCVSLGLLLFLGLLVVCISCQLERELCVVFWGFLGFFVVYVLVFWFFFVFCFMCVCVCGCVCFWFFVFFWWFGLGLFFYRWWAVGRF